MTESGKPVAPRRDEIENLRLAGSVIAAAGAALCVLALVAEGGEPPWQVLAVFGLAALAGVVLRIEAAIRDRG